MSTPSLEDDMFVLDLPSRVYNALWRQGIRTVGDVIRQNEDDLLRWRNVGPKAVSDLKQRLAERHLELSEPPTPLDPSIAEHARWIGEQLESLSNDDRVIGRLQAVEGDVHGRRIAWAFYRWGLDPDAGWPSGKAGGRYYMALPLPGSVDLHLEGLNRLAHRELGS